MKHNLFFFAVLLYFIQIQTASGSTASNGTCIVPGSPPVSPTLSEWVSIRNKLTPQFDNCLSNPNYFALFGASLLYTENVERSVEMLERALLLDPDNGSAQIDYAEALFKSGQLLSAIQVNKSILARDDLPEELINFLKSRDQAWNELRYQNRYQATYLYGFSSNLNNATFVKDVDLTTLSGQTQTATLDDSILAKSGRYHFITLNSNFYELQQQGTSAFSIDIKSRISDYHQFDTDELNLSYENEHEGIDIRQSWGASIGHVQYGDRSLYTTLEANFDLYPTNRVVMPYLNIDSRYINFSSDKELNEASIGFTPGIAIGSSKNRLGLELEYNYNKSLENRAGGNRYRTEGRFYWDIALYGGRFITRLSYSESKDKEGYSSLLSDNAIRSTRSTSFTTQYFYPLSKNAVVHASYYNKDQDSNISLFKNKTKSFDLGFTYRF